MSKLFYNYDDDKNEVWTYNQVGEDGEIIKLWRCRSVIDAKELIHQIDQGAIICRGSKEFGNNCGTCIKCLMVI